MHTEHTRRHEGDLVAAHRTRARSRVTVVHRKGTRNDQRVDRVATQRPHGFGDEFHAISGFQGPPGSKPPSIHMLHGFRETRQNPMR